MMLTGVLVFLLLTVALLSVPLTLTCELSSRPGQRNEVAVAWGVGLPPYRIALDRGAGDSPETASKEPPHSSPSRNGSGLSRAFIAIRQKALRRRLTLFAGELWHAIDKNDVRLDLRIGLGDPADTGQLWAVAGPITGVLQCVDGAEVSIVPDFVDATFEFDGRGRFRLVPLRIIYLMIGLLLSAAVWQALWAIRRGQ